MGGTQISLLIFTAATAFAGVSANGQTPPLEWRFTNRVATFTNLQGQAMVNASLIRADGSQLIFKTNDVYGTVNLTNLAPATLEMLGVPASYLQQVRAREKEQAGAAARAAALWKTEQEQLRNPDGLLPFMVESIVSSDYDTLFGQLRRCNVRMTNGAATTVWVARLPDSVPAYLQKKKPWRSRSPN